MKVHPSDDVLEEFLLSLGTEHRAEILLQEPRFHTWGVFELLYTKQGRTADLKQLAAEMVPIFASRQIHREALAALAFFKQAVEAEKASLEVVTRVAAYLREAEHDSALPFRETETQKPKRPWDPGKVEE